MSAKEVVPSSIIVKFVEWNGQKLHVLRDGKYFCKRLRVSSLVAVFKTEKRTDFFRASVQGRASCTLLVLLCGPE